MFAFRVSGLICDLIHDLFLSNVCSFVFLLIVFNFGFLFVRLSTLLDLLLRVIVYLLCLDLLSWFLIIFRCKSKLSFLYWVVLVVYKI